jgi:hypothetical protein
VPFLNSGMTSFANSSSDSMMCSLTVAALGDEYEGIEMRLFVAAQVWRMKAGEPMKPPRRPAR